MPLARVSYNCLEGPYWTLDNLSTRVSMRRSAENEQPMRTGKPRLCMSFLLCTIPSCCHIGIGPAQLHHRSGCVQASDPWYVVTAGPSKVGPGATNAGRAGAEACLSLLSVKDCLRRCWVEGRSVCTDTAYDAVPAKAFRRAGRPPED